jgi:type III pantothenate kinase
MLLALDIGNTEVTVGLFSARVLLGQWRLTTVADRTPDEWAIALDACLRRTGHAPTDVSAACLASVAPAVTSPLLQAIRSGYTEKVGLVEASATLPLVLDVDEPLAVGPDRIANVLAALDRHPGDSIVVDFGTATTFDCVTADRRFIGGSIMPGLRTSAEQLVRKAAKLTATELVAPSRAIGRRTDEHIRGGVLFGSADAVDGMVRRIRAEWPTSAMPTVIATGGLAGLVAPHTTSVQLVEPDLTLHGILVAADALGLQP